MNISLDLPSELENELSTEASHLKLPLAEYILRLLSLRPFLQNPPKTGPELVAYWESVGVIGSRPDIIDSQEQATANKTISEALRLAAMSTTYRTPNEVFYEGRSDSDSIQT